VADANTREQSGEESGEQTGEQAIEQTGEQVIEQAGEQAGEQTGEQTIEQMIEQAVEQTDEQAIEQMGEQAIEETGEQAAAGVINPDVSMTEGAEGVGDNSMSSIVQELTRMSCGPDAPDNDSGKQAHPVLYTHILPILSRRRR
jgi:hypothetical protein